MCRGEGFPLSDAGLYDKLGEGLNMIPLQCGPLIEAIRDLEEDVSLESQYSNWVRKNFTKVNKMFGMIIDGLEIKILNLIEEMEQNLTETEKSSKKGKKKKESREKEGVGN